MAGRRVAMLALGVSVLVCFAAVGTETEHLGFSVVPVKSAGVNVDGQTTDWDLSGSVFVCGDVERFRGEYGLWLSAMWDRENLYVLARWVDHTPMNNPGRTSGDMGFKGDSLQFRTITGKEDRERVAHLTCWLGSDGRDLVEIAYGRDFKGGGLKDARQEGAKQAFAVREDGKGYVQEIAIPWALLTKDGKLPATGEFAMTVEGNFTLPTGRLTIKDLFMPGVKPDRIFTFRAYSNWSPATLESGGGMQPRPVRLADGRELSVKYVGGLPEVDWSGLVRQQGPAGFKAIEYAMPVGGTVSMVIGDARGRMVRGLLAQAEADQGPQRVMWDGLTTGLWGEAGEVVEAGEYRWQAVALAHDGVRLELRGWAMSGGQLPWETVEGGGWGGDHGEPSGVDADAEGVYLGWGGAEAGKALVKMDGSGRVKWRQTRGGMGGAGSVAVLDGVVYALDHGEALYRVSASGGEYMAWEGKTSADRDVISLVDVDKTKATKATALAAVDGRIFVAYRDENLIAALNAKTGELEKRLTIEKPGDMKAGRGKLYVISSGSAVVEIDAATGRRRTVIGDLEDAKAIALSGEGGLFVALGGTTKQIVKFNAGGQEVGRIGRAAGRAMTGPWTAGGVGDVNAMVLDAAGRLWVMEAGMTPKRISVWNAADGALVNEYFGATHYGASGGAINPLDPNVMIGEGCEWRIDPATGHAKITGIVEQRIAGSARFNVASNGTLYLTTFEHHKIKDAKAGEGLADFRVYRRLGEGMYQLCAQFNSQSLELWSDWNGDGQRQDQEIQHLPVPTAFGGYYGWSNGMADDMSLLGWVKDQGVVRLPAAGFSESGAPKWNVAALERLPLPVDCGFAYPSGDGRLALVMGGKTFGEQWVCVEVSSGKVLWTYPNPFAGVHGSHRAPPAESGLIRGAFGVIGAGKLPDPVGRFWVINTNKGEWHILNEHGFYITRLFEGDLLRAKWPTVAQPGTLLNRVPPGSGEEDFGGSMTQLPDGRIFLQTGKSSLWAVQLVGLETLRTIGEGRIQISEADVITAREFQARQPRQAAGTRQTQIVRRTPVFTGDFAADCKDMSQVTFGNEQAIQVAFGWDEKYLHLGYEVKDQTPWINGADAAEQMYSRGDTVDFQIGTDEQADVGRPSAAAGDVRVSIGSFKGEPTMVIYREVNAVKNPMTFSSGVVRSFVVDHVKVVRDAKVKVHVTDGRYTVQASIPWELLMDKPPAGRTLRGDFGVTFGNATGKRTALRSYWSNQQTGLVSDEVYELKLEPARWGELQFQP